MTAADKNTLIERIKYSSQYNEPCPEWVCKLIRSLPVSNDKTRQANKICFDPECYPDNEIDWFDINDVMKILIRNNYITVLHEEDFGLTYLEFESQDRRLGEPYPFWLSPEEEERLISDSEMGENDDI